MILCYNTETANVTFSLNDMKLFRSISVYLRYKILSAGIIRICHEEKRSGFTECSSRLFKQIFDVKYRLLELPSARPVA
jgi:hypothetical protein